MKNLLIQFMQYYLYNFNINYNKFLHILQNFSKFINFIQNDAETVNFLLFYAPMTIVVPFQICMNIYMLFNLFGTSFLYSLVCFIFLVAIAWFVEDFYIYN